MKIRYSQILYQLVWYLTVHMMYFQTSSLNLRKWGRKSYYNHWKKSKVSCLFLALLARLGTILLHLLTLLTFSLVLSTFFRSCFILARFVSTRSTRFASVAGDGALFLYTFSLTFVLFAWTAFLFLGTCFFARWSYLQNIKY